MDKPLIVVEQHPSDKLPFDVNSYQIWDAANDLFYETKLIDYIDIKLYPESSRVKDILAQPFIPCGSIRFIHFWLKQLNIPIPPPLDYPEELWCPLEDIVCRLRYPEEKTYLRCGVIRRGISRTTLESFMSALGSSGPCGPLFIKPVRHKAFTGFVVNQENWVKKMSFVAENMNPEEEIWVSDVVDDIQSEWRVFVKDKEVVGIQPYKLDLKCSNLECPQQYQIRPFINNFKSAPRAYSLDLMFYIDKEEYDLSLDLIEVNDGYALGSYGLDKFTYFDFLKARWEELTTSEAQK